MMSTPRCPVCERPQDADAADCLQCGWTFPIALGTPEESAVVLRQQLEAARVQWQQRRYDPGQTPYLLRDPFETVTEFAARLAARSWYVGQGALQKSEYDLESGRFPVRIVEMRDWARAWLGDVKSCHIRLPREASRLLYEQSPTWPVYAKLVAQGQDAQLHALILVVPEGELMMFVQDWLDRDIQDFIAVLSDPSSGNTRHDVQWLREKQHRWMDWQETAKHGDAAGQFFVGHLYETGVGVKESKEEAALFIRNSADQGLAPAQTIMGLLCSEGIGVEKDYSQAVSWFRKAAEQDCALGKFYLADCYWNGCGVSQDYAQAIDWCRQAAKQGHAEAQTNLANCYWNGLGVAQDYAQAVIWFRQAAERDDARGQCNLGSCYYHGLGVAQDYAQAVMWFRQAAEQGHAESQTNLGNCYWHGSGVAQNDAEAVRWYRKAAEQGDAQGQCNLAVSTSIK